MFKTVLNYLSSLSADQLIDEHKHLASRVTSWISDLRQNIYHQWRNELILLFTWQTPGGIIPPPPPPLFFFRQLFRNSNMLKFLNWCFQLSIDCWKSKILTGKWVSFSCSCQYLIPNLSIQLQFSPVCSPLLVSLHQVTPDKIQTVYTEIN